MAQRQLRADLYRGARLMGDVQAAEQGPTAFGKRLVRRRVYRTTNKQTRRALRMVGLSK